MNKGRIIYISVLCMNTILMVIPSSTSLFQLSINTFEQFNLSLLTDLLAILVTLAGYFLMKIYYKKNSKYRKNYVYFTLFIAVLWTGLIQVK